MGQDNGEKPPRGKNRGPGCPRCGRVRGVLVPGSRSWVFTVSVLRHPARRDPPGVAGNLDHGLAFSWSWLGLGLLIVVLVYSVMRKGKVCAMARLTTRLLSARVVSAFGNLQQAVQASANEPTKPGITQHQGEEAKGAAALRNGAGWVSETDRWGCNRMGQAFASAMAGAHSQQEEDAHRGSAHR